MELEAKGDIESLEKAYVIYKEGLAIKATSKACKGHLGDVVVKLYDLGIRKSEIAILHEYRESMKNKK